MSVYEISKPHIEKSNIVHPSVQTHISIELHCVRKFIEYYFSRTHIICVCIYAVLWWNAKYLYLGIVSKFCHIENGSL